MMQLDKRGSTYYSKLISLECDELERIYKEYRYDEYERFLIKWKQWFLDVEKTKANSNIHIGNIAKLTLYKKQLKIFRETCNLTSKQHNRMIGLESKIYALEGGTGYPYELMNRLLKLIDETKDLMINFSNLRRRESLIRVPRELLINMVIYSKRRLFFGITPQPFFDGSFYRALLKCCDYINKNIDTVNSYINDTNNSIKTIRLDKDVYIINYSYKWIANIACRLKIINYRRCEKCRHYNINLSMFEQKNIKRDTLPQFYDLNVIKIYTRHISNDVKFFDPVDEPWHKCLCLSTISRN
jgi:hypothetical protein